MDKVKGIANESVPFDVIKFIDPIEYIDFLEGVKSQLQTHEKITLFNSKGIGRDVVDQWIKTIEAEILSTEENKSIRGNDGSHLVEEIVMALYIGA